MRKYLTTSHWEKEREAACIKRNGRLEAVCTCRGKNKRRNNKDMEGSWSFLHQCIVHLRHLTFMHIKKIGRVAAGLAGSRVNGFRLGLDRSHARVGRVPGQLVGPVRVSKLW